MLTQNKVLWLHCTINGIATWVIQGVFKCHASGIVTFYWQKRLHDGCFSEVIAFWARVLHTEKSIGVLKLWNCYWILPGENWYDRSLQIMKTPGNLRVTCMIHISLELPTSSSPRDCTRHGPKREFGERVFSSPVSHPCKDTINTRTESPFSHSGSLTLAFLSYLFNYLFCLHAVTYPPTSPFGTHLSIHKQDFVLDL